MHDFDDVCLLPSLVREDGTLRADLALIAHPVRPPAFHVDGPVRLRGAFGRRVNSITANLGHRQLFPDPLAGRKGAMSNLADTRRQELSDCLAVTMRKR